MEWEKADIETKTLYKAFSSKEIDAHIAIKIGLRGVNITMKGIFVALSSSIVPKILGKIFSYQRLRLNFNLDLSKLDG